MNRAFKEVQKLQIKSAKDARGSFVKFFDASLLNSVDFVLQQQNYVHTIEPFTLRGLHFQSGEFAEAKIFRVLQGAIQLGFFDTRVNSTTYEQSSFLVLDQIEDAYYIPKGFATGYLTLQPDTIVLYMSDNHYAPSLERGIRPNDPILKIQWQSEKYLFSEKDQNWKNWRS